MEFVPKFFSSKEFIIHFQYEFNSHLPKKSFYLGNPAPNRKCLFCGRSENETLFKDDSHVIPEALGNKHLFSNEECYECNQKAGKDIENEFIKGIEPYRLFSKSTGKHGQSKLKKVGINSYYKGMTDQKPLELVNKGDENKIFEDVDGSKLKLNIPVNTYRPISIPKELARLGLFTSLDLRVNEYNYLRNWVNGEDQIFPSYYSYFWKPGGIFPSTNFMLLEYVGKYQTEGPKFLAVLSFGCITLVYHFLKNNNSLLRPWPVPALFFEENEYGKPICKIEKILNNGKAKNDWMNFEIHPAIKINTIEENHNE